jgi:hypothetical protein
MQLLTCFFPYSKTVTFCSGMCCPSEATPSLTTTRGLAPKCAAAAAAAAAVAAAAAAAAAVAAAAVSATPFLAYPTQFFNIIPLHNFATSFPCTIL